MGRLPAGAWARPQPKFSNDSRSAGLLSLLGARLEARRHPGHGVGPVRNNAGKHWLQLLQGSVSSSVKWGGNNL